LSPAYILTNAAEADIRSIVRCTRQQWGAAQTRAYMVKLEQGIARLARGLGHQRDMGAMHAGLRMARCERHYVFCLDREDAAAGLGCAARADGSDPAHRGQAGLNFVISLESRRQFAVYLSGKA
jgi:plasmid stabilization system protein ParE